MRLLLRAYDDPTEEATYAVVEIDVDEILQRHELMNVVAAADKNLAEGHFWDERVAFYGMELPEDLLHDFEEAGEERMVLPDHVDTDSWDHLGTDKEMMVVHDVGVYWTAYPAHGPDSLFTTAILHYEVVAWLKEKRTANQQRAVKTEMACDKCEHAHHIVCRHPYFQGRRVKPLIIAEQGSVVPLFCPLSKEKQQELVVQ